MATACVINKPHGFIRKRKLDLIHRILDEASLALENPARTMKDSRMPQDVGYELLSGKWELGGFSGLS